MKVKFFLIHGSFGNPEENWFPWLKHELEKQGHKVFAPKFPTPEGQSLSSWLKVLDGFEGEIDEETVFVGHSAGPALILRELERRKTPVRACFLVSGFLGKLGLPEFDAVNASFFEKPFDWKKIRANCRTFRMINSDNDPYVPLAKGKELAKLLGTELIVVKGGGHLNEKAGFKDFPLLLEKIREVATVK